MNADKTNPGRALVELRITLEREERFAVAAIAAS
jgi:hypothetical protein